MTIKVLKRPNEAEYILSGRLDSVTSPEAENVLVEAIRSNEKLALNFTELEYISSAGLRVMKRLYIEGRNLSHQLVIRGTGKMVMEVFEMTGFSGLFQFE